MENKNLENILNKIKASAENKENVLDNTTEVTDTNKEDVIKADNPETEVAETTATETVTEITNADDKSTDLADTDNQKEISNMDMMIKISKNEQNLQDIKLLTSAKVTDQLKVFLISQARNELTRVIKLTNFLDTIENNYMSKINQAMMDDALTLKQYGDILENITTLLNRSNEIITKVLKDESLTAILNTTIYANNTTTDTQTSIVSQLKDPQSRERVRNVINNILYHTQNYNPNDFVEEVPNTVIVEGDQKNE